MTGPWWTWWLDFLSWWHITGSYYVAEVIMHVPDRGPMWR